MRVLSYYVSGGIPLLSWILNLYYVDRRLRYNGRYPNVLLPLLFHLSRLSLVFIPYTPPGILSMTHYIGTKLIVYNGFSIQNDTVPQTSHRSALNQLIINYLAVLDKLVHTLPATKADQSRSSV